MCAFESLQGPGGRHQYQASIAQSSGRPWVESGWETCHIFLYSNSDFNYVRSSLEKILSSERVATGLYLNVILIDNKGEPILPDSYQSQDLKGNFISLISGVRSQKKSSTAVAVNFCSNEYHLELVGSPPINGCPPGSLDEKFELCRFDAQRAVGGILFVDSENQFEPGNDRWGIHRLRVSLTNLFKNNVNPLGAQEIYFAVVPILGGPEASQVQQALIEMCEELKQQGVVPEQTGVKIVITPAHIIDAFDSTK